MSPLKDDSSTETETYTLLKGTHSRMEDGANVRYSKGDQIELTDKEAQALGARVQKGSSQVVGQPGQYAPSVATTEVEADTDPGEEVLTGPPEGVDTLENTEVEDVNDWSFLGELSAPNAIKAINDLQTVGEVEAAREAEEGGKNRKSVLEAADNRIGELGG